MQGKLQEEHYPLKKTHKDKDVTIKVPMLGCAT